MNNRDYTPNTALLILSRINKLFDDYAINGDKFYSFGDYLRSKDFTLQEINSILRVIKFN